MPETITFRSDPETETALAVLTADGGSTSAAIRRAVLAAAERQTRDAELRKALLRRTLPAAPIGLADAIIAEREDSR